MTSRQHGSFEAPFFNPGQPEHVIWLSGDGLEVWLYEDAISFHVRRFKFIAEQIDYGSGEELIADARNALKTALAG